ncbi:hypothetical protein BH20ACT2_BH20ACT2_22290 [soil metagenome]
MPRNVQTIIDHADELAARFESAEPSALTDIGHAAVFDLRDAVVDRGRAEARILAAVTRARAEGVSWAVLASVLGTSREAVRQRYGAQPAEE